MTFIEAELYRQILELIPIACVDVAIVSGGKVLLVKREDEPARGQWWLPGGRIFKDEMMRDAALRKARDEVGIECNVGPIIHTAETIFADGPGGVAVHSINTCFFLYPRDKKPDVKLDRHHGEFIWIDAVDRGYHQYVQSCLLSAGLSYI